MKPTIEQISNQSAESKSLDITDDNIEQLKQIFPDVFSEGKVDFEALKAALGEVLDDSDERYNFTWNGKNRARQIAQTPSTGTLRPCKEDSVNWDSTENLFIEGDNLEVLKLLQKSYHKKVKMIYIDPPYNTGNDFVYKDNFHNNIKNYLELTGQLDEAGRKLSTNAETSGRFHSDWLNMMYPRLKLARNLLKNDGVIFIHIDDNEQSNLKQMCDEVFGADNFINIITIKTKVGGVSGSSEGKSLKDSTEFILAYSKNKDQLLLNPTYIKTKLFEYITAYKEQGKSWKYTSVITELEGRERVSYDTENKISYYKYSNFKSMSVTAFAKEKRITVEDVYNQYADKIYRTTNAQSSMRQRVIDNTNNTDGQMFSCVYTPKKGKNADKEIEILYTADHQRNMVMFLSDMVEEIGGEFFYLNKVDTLWNDIEYNNLSKEGGINFPNGKKPLKLLKRLLNLGSNHNDIIMDFFAGSASTADAVIQMNEEEQKNRKFILVQLPEPISEKDQAYQDGYRFVSQITVQRIKNALSNTNIGFQNFKLDETNIRRWDADFDDLAPALQLAAKSIKIGRESEDVLYEVLLKYGIELTTLIEEEVIEGKKVFVVGAGALIVCLDDDITEAVVEGIATLIDELEPESTQVVFKDEGFANDDNVKTNAVQILKQHGVEDVKSI